MTKKRKKPVPKCPDCGSNLKRKRVPKDPPRKYPYLFGCYVDEGFERVYARQRIQGSVTLSHYKGHMLLSADGKPHENRAVWLDGEDLEELIKIFAEARLVWLKAYKRTVRELIKRGDKKVREAFPRTLKKRARR